MSKKKERNTKGKIVSAAWRLFYKQGYEETTVEEIIEESGTSRGSFYHYFAGKDALLSTLSYLFDEKYEELMDELPEDMDAFDALMFLNRELFELIENTVSVDLLAQLHASQLITKGSKYLLDRSRTYYKVLRQICLKGQQCGELRADCGVNEIVKAYAICERGLMYDWCICNGEYSLKSYSATMLPMMMQAFRAVK